MGGLFELLPKIQAHPGMYIGRASAHDLFIFLEGYQTARQEVGIEPTEQEIEFLREFQPWLQERYNVSTSGSWARIIEFYTPNMEQAFHRFFELLDEFRQRNQGSGVKLIVSEAEQVKAG